MNDVPSVVPGVPPERAAHPLLLKAMPALQRAAPGLMGPLLRRHCRVSDLVQSALVDAIRSFPGYAGTRDSEFVGWTLRILERNCLDRRRRLVAERRDVGREQAQDSHVLELQQVAPSPAQIAIDREHLTRLARALRTLPRDQRRILQLVCWHSRSHAEVARILDRSEGACRVLLARSRAALLVILARQSDHGRD